MNVTFDTNVFVSGFTRPEGRAGQALAHIVTDGDVLFASKAIIDELRRVLAEKFGWTEDELEEVNDWFVAHSNTVQPREELSVLADEPDNRILECALAANADVIVTGDRAMLALARIGNTRIITLSEYLRGVDNPLINS